MSPRRDSTAATVPVTAWLRQVPFGMVLSYAKAIGVHAIISWSAAGIYSRFVFVSGGKHILVKLTIHVDTPQANVAYIPK